MPNSMVDTNDTHGFACQVWIGGLQFIQTQGMISMRAKVAKREWLGIRPGTVMEYREEEGKLVAVEVESLDPLGEAYAKLGRGRCTEEPMRGFRAGFASGIFMVMKVFR